MKEILLRFKIGIESESESSIRMNLLPKFLQDAASFRRMQIIVDKKTMIIIAQQILGSSTNQETVYTVTDVKINDEFPLHASRLYPEKTNYRDYKIDKLFID